MWDKYVQELAKAAAAVPADAASRLASEICRVSRNGGIVFLIGNGGSAAVADHAAADLSKGTAKPGQGKIRALPLSSLMSLLSASNNDFGHGVALENLVKIYLNEQDMLVAISSSGRSANIINAAKSAVKKGASLATLTGFGGGPLSQLGDLNLVVPSNNYGIVEDTHQALFHCIQQDLSRD